LELMPNVINKIKQNSSDMNEIILAPCDVISKIKQNSSDMNEILLAPCDVISKIKQNSSDMNESILAPCDVISKIKQNSSDMNEIMLAPCDAGYVQSCTGSFKLPTVCTAVYYLSSETINKWLCLDKESILTLQKSGSFFKMGTIDDQAFTVVNICGQKL
jgi:hypothetical protein